MKWLHYCLMGLLVVSISNSAPLSQAQDAPEPVRVGLVIERQGGVETATASNIGDDGITRYRDVIADFGVVVEELALDGPIPPRFDVLILIRPRLSLGFTRTAYLWDYLSRGGHLLLALDPNGHNRTFTENELGGLSQLLETEYGINLTDSLLIEDWASFETLSDLTQSWSTAQAEVLAPHPITEPLLRYDLPLRFWGARNLQVDAVTGLAATHALLRVEGPYGETRRVDFFLGGADQLALDIGDDLQGRFLIASIATNLESGSRVALIGDSEMFQNIYGQTRVPGLGETPRYPGTFLFTQRLTAWVLGVAEAEWPALPEGFTWVTLDGAADDWPAELVRTPNPMPENGLRIETASAFRNDQFVYLLLETSEPLPIGAQVRIVARDADGDSQVIVASERSVFSRDALVTDAAAAFGAVAELRLPRRLFDPAQPQLTQICVQPTPLALPTCYDTPLTPANSVERDPAPLRGPDAPQAFVRNGANLRTAPSTDAGIIASLPARELLEVIGRNTAGDWVQVRNGRYEGWMATFLLVLNADVDRLAVVG